MVTTMKRPYRRRVNHTGGPKDLPDPQVAQTTAALRLRDEAMSSPSVATESRQRRRTIEEQIAVLEGQIQAIKSKALLKEQLQRVREKPHIAALLQAMKLLEASGSMAHDARDTTCATLCADLRRKIAPYLADLGLETGLIPMRVKRKRRTPAEMAAARAAGAA